MNGRLAIFDLDGTLIDSRRLIHDAMLHAYDRCGLADPGFDRIRHVIGLGLKQAFAALEPDASDPLLAALEAAYIEAFVILRETDVGQEPMYPGARALLEDMRRDGWRLGVATGKSRRGVTNIFKRHDLGSLFDASVCADDGPGKPDPFMAQENLRLLAHDRRSAVLIGDATHDMRMARSAGMRALGVTWGFATESEIRDAGAHEIHHAFDTLQESLYAFAPEVGA
jgi:phosphoglycolate phosphatase